MTGSQNPQIFINIQTLKRHCRETKSIQLCKVRPISSQHTWNEQCPVVRPICCRSWQHWRKRGAQYLWSSLPGDQSSFSKYLHVSGFWMTGECTAVIIPPLAAENKNYNAISFVRKHLEVVDSDTVFTVSSEIVLVSTGSHHWTQPMSSQSRRCPSEHMTHLFRFRIFNPDNVGGI